MELHGLLTQRSINGRGLVTLLVFEDYVFTFDERTRTGRHIAVREAARTAVLGDLPVIAHHINTHCEGNAEAVVYDLSP